jgi:hypothetical protein
VTGERDGGGSAAGLGRGHGEMQRTGVHGGQEVGGQGADRVVSPGGQIAAVCPPCAPSHDHHSGSIRVTVSLVAGVPPGEALIAVLAPLALERVSDLYGLKSGLTIAG